MSDRINKGALIWTESPGILESTTIVEGPFILLTPWRGYPESKSFGRNAVKYIDSATGNITKITYNMLLFTSIFVLKDNYKQQNKGKSNV